MDSLVNAVWKKIKDPARTFIIAEAGVNHNGSLKKAKQLVDAAVGAGADAIKFQTFKARHMVSAFSPMAKYQIENTGIKESQFNMISRLQLSFREFEILYRYCQRKNITFLSTPFDYESADFLEKLGVTVFKISSGEITNISFLTHVAEKKIPMLVSTGMSTMSEVASAVKAIQKVGNKNVLLLQCVSDYPAAPEDVNLRAMHTMADAFGLPVGFSDHTLGIEIPLAAVALGAWVIEKHFTLDSHLSGPDHKASLEPSEFKLLVKGIRKVESALGDGYKCPSIKEKEIALISRKSLVASKKIKKGTILLNEHVVIKRPGSGLLPSMKSSLMGKVSKVTIEKDQLLLREMFL